MARLITLQTFLDRSDGLFLCSFLNAHGFFALAADEAVTGQDWMRALAIGGVRVQVLDSELQDIRAVLTDAGLMQDSWEGRKASGIALPLHRRSGFLRRHLWLVLPVALFVVVWMIVPLDPFVRLEAGQNEWQLAVTVVLALLTGVFPMVLPLLRSRHTDFAEEDNVADRNPASAGVGLTTLRRYSDPGDAENCCAFLKGGGVFAVTASEIGGSVLDFRVLVRDGELTQAVRAMEARDLSDGISTREAAGSPRGLALHGLLSRNLELLLAFALIVLIAAGPIWRLLSDTG